MHRLPPWLLVTTGTLLLGAAAVACSSSENKSSPLPLSDDTGGTKKRDSGATSSSSSSSSGSSGEEPLEGGAASGRVYAHTRDTLYLFEPLAKKLTPIGKFDCITAADSVIDLAVDRSGAMYATTFHKFLTVDPTNAKCTVVKEEAATTYYPNSLSFVPIGTVDATKEALVGYAEDGNTGYIENYVRIEPTTGAMTTIGNLNPNGGVAGTYYDVAGDLVALIRDANRAYVIVKPDAVTDGGAPTDYLAEIDPKTGTIKQIVGPTSQVNTYGFGYWAGKGYGFSADGRLTEIDMSTGKTTNVLSIDAGGGWYGAGVTTDSPVVP